MQARITKSFIDKLKPGEKDVFVYDTELKGFGLKVTPKGKKTFFVQYRLGGRETYAKRKSLGAYGTISPDEARRDAKGYLGDVARGIDFVQKEKDKRADITLSKLCDEYLKEGCAHKKGSTLATDRGRIDRHIKPLLGNKMIKEISKGDVQKFMNDVASGKTAKSVKTKKYGLARVTGGKGTATRTIGLLGGIFSYSIDQEYLKENPVHGVKRFKDKVFERFLSEKEFNKLGDALREAENDGTNPNAIAIIRLLILTGCRFSEISTLKWKYIDEQFGYLRLPDSKTGQKLVPIGRTTIELLNNLPHTNESEYVFPATNNLKKTYQGAPKIWRNKIRKLAEIDDVRIHDLRHSFASVSAGGGDSLLVIGKILGHKDIKTTKRYAHLSDNPLKNTVERISNEISDFMKSKED
jgi:integrase